MLRFSGLGYRELRQSWARNTSFSFVAWHGLTSTRSEGKGTEKGFRVKGFR